MLSAVENGPCDLARVLALEEKRLGFAVLETEDLGIAPDVELALYFGSVPGLYHPLPLRKCQPFQGRSWHRRRYLRRHAL